jgi:hypothetical protein
MLAEIVAIGTGIANTAKALKGLLDTVQDVKTREQIRGIQDDLIGLQTNLLAVQAQYQALAEAKSDVEKKLVAYENWDAEAARYQLQEVASGIFVYVLKPENAGSEPIHWLCPNCFQRREKSILTKPTVDHLNYKCHRCSFDVGTKTAYSPRSDADDFSFGMGDLGQQL